MHNMLSLAIVSLLGLASSSQARALHTSNSGLVQRAVYQDFPNPKCTVKNPGSSICGKVGSVASPSYRGSVNGGQFYVSVGTAQQNLAQCQALCQKFSDCASMSWDASIGKCSLYTKSVALQGFTASPGQPFKFYDKNCLSCADITCLPTLINQGFEFSTKSDGMSPAHFDPWQADPASAVDVSSMGYGGLNSLSITAAPGQPVKVHQPFNWCSDAKTPYKISFSYKFLNNIPGSGMDVDYSGQNGHGGPPPANGEATGTTIFDAVNPGTSGANSVWQTKSVIVHPQYQADLTFYVYSNPFYAESQTVLIDGINIKQQIQS